MKKPIKTNKLCEKCKEEKATAIFRGKEVCRYCFKRLQRMANSTKPFMQQKFIEFMKG